MLKTKEWLDLIEFFERTNPGRNDKEPKELMKIGRVYQDGERNKQYEMFLSGYMLGRSVYLN